MALNSNDNGQGTSAAHITGAVVIGCIVALWGIRHGFRGITGNVGGVSAGVHL
jgi:hypothetical protein